MTDKRTQLIEATIDLFSKEGFWNTSTARISKHAGVATGTLFNYFPTKEALIDEIYLQLKREVRDFVFENYAEEAPLPERMQYLWNRYAQWAFEHPGRFRLMEQLRISELVSHRAVHEVEEEEAFMIQVIEEAHAQAPRGDLSVRHLCKMIYAMLASTILFALDANLSGRERQEHLNGGFSVLLQGIAKGGNPGPSPE